MLSAPKQHHEPPLLVWRNFLTAFAVSPAWPTTFTFEAWELRPWPMTPLAGSYLKI